MEKIKDILSVLGALILGILVVSGFEELAHRIFPPREGMRVTDGESLRSAVEATPAPALILIVAAYALGSLLGGFAISRLRPRGGLYLALLFGGLFMLLGIINMTLTPHPFWFWLLAMPAFMPLAWTGHILSAKMRQL